MKPPLKILMLEDSRDDADLIMLLLARAGLHAEFECCDTQESYLQALKTFKPDLVLADNSLPQFSGIEALDIARRVNASIPFILVAGTVSEEFAVTVIKYGADDYILKDRLERLPLAISAVLKQKKSERQRAEAIERLAQNEALFSSIVNSSEDAIISKNLDGKITSWNKAAESLFGYTEEEVIGKNITIIIPEDLRVDEPVILDKIKKGERVEHYETRRIRKNGTSLIVSLTVSPVRNRKGVIIGASKIARDITDKKLLAGRLSAILNTLPANIALLDEKGNIVDVNDSWKNFAGDNGFMGADYGIGSNYIQVAAGTTGDDQEDSLKVALGIGAVLKKDLPEFVFEYTCHSPAIQRWFRMVVTPLDGKEYMGAVVMHIDISELRKLEQERLKSKMEEQKKITEAMFVGQEKERNAIGVELHDNVNQLLVGTILLLSLVKKAPSKYLEFIDSCIDNIKNAINENRKIAHELVTPNQESETLLDQINRLCESMLQPAGLKTSILHDSFGENLISDQKKLAVYRIVQEQCTNIIKHAQARHVNFFLSTADHIFTMRLTDDGIGVSNRTIGAGIGVQNMTSRLAVLNGALAIDSGPGKGFSLLVKIPLEENKPAV